MSTIDSAEPECPEWTEDEDKAKAEKRKAEKLLKVRRSLHSESERLRERLAIMEVEAA